ncbi:MAG: glycosyltransferase family 2 protein, partial [Oscillatoriaceae bacterium SKYG93]|nr:glycosyltransferase family 2 protein [Oscillatoriaceae bacterium SKYG93]MDW8455139.1 glycosyltransferase family A protein [Oscillatoriaceae cyanobacterium SKYGB_i_bin93]
QSYTNWRCIVIDSFSHDGSWEIIQDFSERDKRFELYQIPKNINFYHTWNFGLSKVKNKYFCILTSDDVWNKEW